MSILKLCFVLMVVGSSAKAQQKETCLYHVSFYKWEWNYCSGMDTMPIYDSEGFLSRDSVFADTANHPHIFFLEREDSTSFANAHFEVTSMDGKINYEVLSFDFGTNPYDSFWGMSYCEGANLNRGALKKLYHFKSGDHFWLEYLRIFDPNLQKQIVLPGIEIQVE
ncbi:MAG TPA: hypothetical protein VE978_23280 [Chitinophagales bacterium]|nr:hypothetical protein [Chitinophagales bacterium]